MNVFSNYPQFIVTGFNGIIPTGKVKYSNATGDIADLTAQLASKNTALATAQAALSKNDGDIAAIQTYIRQLLSGSPSADDYSNSHIQQNKIDTVLVPLGAGLKTQIEGLKTEIENLKAQILAANTLALHTANLSPAERAALEKQNADILASQNKAVSRSKNLKILAFSTGALLLLLGIGFVILEVKKGKKATA